MKKWLKRIFFFLFLLFILGIFSILAINFFVKVSVKQQILSERDTLNSYDAILVLGCQVKPNKEPSAMLKDRLDMAIALYNKGVAPVIIMSGDHKTYYYNEVQVMKDYAVFNEIPDENIILDHSGFSTYESIYRLKNVFRMNHVLIVTQEYHLYRALFLANQFNIEVDGVSSNQNNYSNQYAREFREILARNKDFFYGLFKPTPETINEDGFFLNQFQ